MSRDTLYAIRICRCGHIDHATTLRWRPGWLRGLASGACCTTGCKCRAFHKPSNRKPKRSKEYADYLKGPLDPRD